jgi:hypothetical protein
MAADPVLEYWAEMMKRTPISPEVMAQWKALADRSLEAWSRALSEVMATDEFAQLLGASIEQWLAAQASVTGNRAQPPALAAQLGRIEERLRQLEERLDSGESTAGEAAARAPRRVRRRRAA